MKTKKLLIIAALISSVGGVALAHKGATGIVKERMDGMMAMGKALTSVGDMFKGKAEFEPAKIKEAADIVLEHTAAIDKLFPDTKESREGMGTETLPITWEKREDFLALAKELEERTAELKVVAETDDKRKIRIGFAKVSKSCAACHTDYRKPQD